MEYNNEILCRSEYVESAKRPRPTSWSNLKRLTWIVEHAINDDEKEWVYKKLNSIMNALDKKALEDVIHGLNICVVHKYKMRLYEASFFE